jgi:hypothetical protein
VLSHDFFNIFDTWFNCDVVNIYDSREVENAARACAGDLRVNRFDLKNLIPELTKILETWEPKTIMKFIDATDIDWFFDEKTEQILKEILAIMINELRSHQNLERSEYSERSD